MDTLLFGVVTVGFVVFMGIAVFAAWCLGALTVAILDYRWNGSAPKKKE